ncbi:MAG TPA: rod shape-determining protein RodA [Firmicutes bacterium]|nr:rod shape-determining protein RodA [Bacillota bacterium]HOQ24009.1 rod shape-determining protein RodA [Bacillota bacterium]
MWDRRFLRNIDYYMLFSVLGLVMIGLIMVYSATRANTALNGGDSFLFLKKQLLSVVIGLIGMAVIFFLDYRLPDAAYHVLYGFNFFMLLLVLFVGSEANGAKSWINLGFMSFQPAEFAKLLVILTLSKYLAEKESFSSILDLIPPFIHILPSLVLILLQPDFGTALVFIFFFFAMVYMAGAKGRHLLLVIFTGITVIALIFVCNHYFGFPSVPLKDYQIKRLTSFINPDADPRGAGYNVRQAIIAVGSGRFFGKGLFQNTQGRLGFLPEFHTDFIFAVFCEEWGFLGAFVLLMLYLLFIWRSLKVVQQAKERHGSLIATGIMTMFLFHIFENIGMNIGIMPITGIPLPFISSGGSSMMTSLFAVGYLENIWARRQKILF